MMKKKQVKSLAITVETIRKLGATQLGEVAGGGNQSNNGCGSTGSHAPSVCRACQF